MTSYCTTDLMNEMSGAKRRSNTGALELMQLLKIVGLGVWSK